ncbi:MAG TPA: ABC transporter family substrate-binding protein [Acidimicrobiales bacterium]|nr:ABC transporter family substrate-binding protein [Acidimicrobiales bacterium]
MKLRKVGTFRRLISPVAVLAVAGVVMAACGSSSSTGTTATTAGSSSNVKKGGSITYALDENLAGWNVNTSTDNELVTTEILNMIWPSTFILNDKSTPVMNSQLLDSATVTGTNPQTVVYKINPKANWSDGQPIDAEDFWYNWEAQSGSSKVTDIDGKPFDDATTSGYSQIQSVTGSNPANGAACASATIKGIPDTISCANGKTVTVKFSPSYADWKGIWGSDNPIVPAHVAAKVGWNTGFNVTGTSTGQTVVSGAWYTIQNDTENQFVVLKKNPSYWSTPANLDTITFQIFNGDTQAVPAMQNGEVQVINPLEVDLSVVQAASHLTGVTRSLIGGLEYQHIDFNQADPYLAVKEVRQAIAYGTDRKQIVARNVGEILSSITPAGNRMIMPGQPGYQDNGSQYDSVNVAKAKSLLQSAGMTMGSDGYFQPKTGPQAGKDLTFTYKTTSGNALRANIAQLFQNDMKAIGIKITPTFEPAKTLFGTDLPNGQFQMAQFAWSVTPFLSGNNSIFCSYTNKANCSSNHDHYANPQVDQLLNQGASASSTQAEINAYNQADKLIWDDMVTLPLFQSVIFTAWSNKYVNITNNATAQGITWNANEWGLKGS